MARPEGVMIIVRSLAGIMAAAALWALPGRALAQHDEADLAKKLNNPVASLTSLPLQLNYDCCFGPSDGGRETLNIQPVIPTSLGANWNLIVRTILPVIHQDRVTPQNDPATGLGDTTQSFFFSPKETKNGIVWAIGPALLWPTGSAGLGSGKWGAGPTALILRQEGGWTYGMLVNHIWSYADAGDHHRPEVSATFLQPFLSWTSAKHTTFGVNTESSYDWTTGVWTAPINLTVAQLYQFGGHPVQLTAGARAYAASADQGPGWGLRFTTTVLFPN
jgi:hypothetical protein